MIRVDQAGNLTFKTVLTEHDRPPVFEIRRVETFIH